MVVTVSAAQRRFLDECLASVRAQAFHGLEVRVLPWGEGEEFATLAAARNAAIDRAPGMVRLVEASDTLPQESTGTLANLLSTAEAGAAAGASEPVGAHWRGLAHAPGAGALALGGWIIDAGRWRAAGLAFADRHGGFADATLAEAERSLGLASTERVTHFNHGRQAGLPFGHLRRWAQEADAWLTAIQDALAVVETSGPWAAAVLDTRLPAFLQDVESLSEAQWERLSQLVGKLVGLADDRVRVESRMLAWLTAQGDRDRVTDLVISRWREDDDLPTTVFEESVFADLPGLSDLPGDVRRLAERETPTWASLRRVGWEGDLLRLELVAFIRGVETTEPPVVRCWLVGPDGQSRDFEVATTPTPEATKVAAESWHGHDFGWHVARLDPSRLATGTWRVHVELTSQGVRRAGLVEHRDERGSAGRLGSLGRADLDVRPAWVDGALSIQAGVREPRPPAPGVRLTSIESAVDDSALTVTGLTESRGRLVLHDGPVELTSAAVDPTSSGFTVQLPLLTRRWGSVDERIRSGTYRLQFWPEGRTGTLDVGLSNELLARTPTDQIGSTYRVRVRVSPAGDALIELAAPRGDDEIGPHAQRRLQQLYAGEHPIDEGLVYFQAYTGENLTDSPLAIYLALRDKLDHGGQPIEVRWCVADLSVLVPTGAVPVVYRSREWYETLATAHWIVTNIEMEQWFRRKPGQQLLQTFHGNPGKSMGLVLWESMGFTPRRIEASLDHGPRNWTMLLSPSPEMAVHYREQFGYDGPVLDRGYPRDDVLVRPRSAEVRAATRNRLGIADGQRAVLYAPTWRDVQATNYRAAALPDGLDVERAARQLGDGYVILLRGHRFHRDVQAAGARVVDVTAYPSINALMLASDVAVLDYSSLRFDFALTGKPMVFLVPDLDEYTGGRGFLYEYTGSAPGPLVKTTDAVVARLGDLDALAEEYADARAAFNERFNAFQDGHSAERAVEAFFSLP
ncbi:MAG: hypothetical protein JWR35_1524 [Marmoricola sp.]|nr:hypothetical protein [Marmoricola sp.]